ncbi:protein-disulfide reductase DsbD family protein [Pinibacter soli]|uniref:Cytochrome c biogenesis protein CcdA n=1 Tax=Pinibacter soli TaxID=3044211 RepID=A0ABT6R6P7_9BACT|nr:cytochrome c biogenesis protein CcdA [Pinibacter soli]MDI3318232.1 cytochrome c biogenesis protein CcdA [Pinibacter soli]
MFSKYTHTILTAFLLLVGCNLFAQKDSVIKVTATQERLNDKESVIRLKVTTAPGNKIYSIDKKSEESVSSSVLFDSSVQKELKGPIQESGKAITEKDSILLADVKYYKDSVIWSQTVQTPADKKEFEGKISYMVKVGDDYKNGDESFDVTVTKAELSAAPGSNPQDNSLWSFFLGGFLSGLGAFIMPCIYAMVPVTVSFFTKRSTTRQQGIKNALVYSGSIMFVFTLIGFLITTIFGSSALNNMASSAWFNVFVFAMFVVFGISFLGAFEITLPSAFSNKVDSKANLSSYSGIFFMALTLVIVSFSCTVPFIGLLTVWTAQGGKLAPLIGFLGFSMALSLPFALFAFFPALLNKMGKSGGWLNTVKVVLGFIELALALKFLSSADLAYHWRLLDREVYLSLWIVIFGLLGLYLLGKLKFHHDDELPKNDYGHPYLTVTRLFFAIGALTFATYMVPGLWGAPLKGISAWLPEMKTQDFNLNKVSAGSAVAVEGNSNAIKPIKYTDFLESEIHGVDAFFDYEEAMKAAKAANKPVMLDFTGHSCANCRKMEQEVLNSADVSSKLQKDFIVVSLYVDDKFKLPEEERYTSKRDGREVKNMGDKNLDFEATLTGAVSQPQYVFVDLDGKIIKNAGGYEPGIPRFIKILDEVKEGFKKK